MRATAVDARTSVPGEEVAARDDQSLRASSKLLRFGTLGAFVLIMLYFSAEASGFLNPRNLSSVLEQSAVLGVLAFGMTVVVIGGGSDIVTGGIDLSIAANLGMSAAVFAVVVSGGYSDLVAVGLTMMSGLVVGALNAMAVVIAGILPLLATLAVMGICSGVELVLTQNTVVSITSPLTDVISGSVLLGISISAWALIVAAAVFILVVQYAPVGLRLYAVGAHPDAARAAGLPVRRYIAGTYLVSGVCGALAAILYVARLSGVAPGSAGDLLLPVIVVALMGVVFSRRLVATIGGTLLSTLFVSFLRNGFQLLHVSSYWVSGAEGVLILLVVSMTSLTRRGRG